MHTLRYCVFFLFAFTLISCSSGPDTTMYDVSVSINPDGAGTISPTADSSYEDGSTANLRAEPSEEYRFTGWTGDMESSSNPLSLSVDQNYNLTANFTFKEYELTINTEGGGMVDEQVLQQASKQYEHGTVVELTATPAEGYRFVEWQGDVTGSDNPAQITVNDPKEVTAVFEKKSYELSVTTEGEGAVNEEVVQAKAKEYDHGTVVELTASPAEGWQFVEWQGAVTGSDNPQQVTVDKPQEVTTVFEKKSFALNITTEGEGSVTKEPSQKEYEYGSTVNLSAQPADGWQFVEWKGDATGTESSIQITLDAKKSVTAVFKEFPDSPFASGNGTEAYPYEVATIEQLQSVDDYPDAHYIQINDIDASETKNWNGGEGFKPIGDDIIKFKGSYNGDNYRITDLFIKKSTTYSGLFGYVDDSGKISSLVLSSVNIQGSDYTGSLIGRNSGKISNIVVDGDVVGYWRTGGIVGANYSGGELINCMANVDITMSLVFTEIVGGLVGLNHGVITQSHAIGSVEAGKRAGGLVGESFGKIVESFSKGSINATEIIGGLVGQMSSNSIVEKSYSSSEVNGDSNIGGFVGIAKDNSNISTSYASGKVTGNENIGGFVGTNGATIESSYWDTKVTNQSNGVGRGSDDGVTGLTTSEMTGSAAENNMPDFDWIETWVTTDNYPALFWEE